MHPVNERGVVLIECPENIPCDPCTTSCPFGAIIKKEITSLPEVDYSRCTGCSICVSSCPGLAIFVVAIREAMGYVTLPYEFLPLPERGEKVAVLNGEGKEIGKGEVKRVLMKGRDRTAAVMVEVDENIVFDVRNIRCQKAI